MKKVKVVLSAVAVFAVIGGALAFKARQTDKVFIHGPNDPQADRCTLVLPQKTTNPALGGLVHTLASTTAVQSGCVAIDIYNGE